MFDGEEFGKQMVEIVRSHVERTTAPLITRCAALEKRLVELEAREVPVAVKGEPGEKGDIGDAGPAGEVDMDAVADLVTRSVADAIGAIPAPEPGEKGEPGEVDMEAVRAMLAEMVCAIEVPAAKDGVGLADALIDNGGNLVLTMTDGQTRQIGRVVGTDGKDGDKGTDGATFTLDDFDIVPTDERTIEMKFTNGDVTHSFELEFPVPVYRGVFAEGEKYARGDMVTWGGSLWHCDDAKGLKPDASDSGWKLAVKKGRDGKDLR